MEKSGISLPKAVDNLLIESLKFVDRFAVKPASDTDMGLISPASKPNCSAIARPKSYFVIARDPTTWYTPERLLSSISTRVSAKSPTNIGQ